MQVIWKFPLTTFTLWKLFCSYIRWERGLKNHEYVCLTEPLSDGSAWALCRISFFPTPTQQKRQHSLMEVSPKGIYLEEMWARSCQKAEWTPGKLQWIGRKTTHSHNVILEDNYGTLDCIYINIYAIQATEAALCTLILVKLQIKNTLLCWICRKRIQGFDLHWHKCDTRWRY